MNRDGRAQPGFTSSNVLDDRINTSSYQGCVSMTCNHVNCVHVLKYLQQIGSDAGTRH